MARLSIEQITSRFRGELRGLVLRLAISRIAVAAAVLLPVMICLDWYIRFEKPGRWIALVVFVAVIALLIIREAIRPLRRKWKDEEILAYLDSVDPESSDLLVNLKEMRQGDGIIEAGHEQGSAFLEHTLAALEARLSELRLNAVLLRGPVKRWQGLAALFLCLAIAIAAVLPLQAGIGLKRLFLPFANIRWSALTTLEVVQPDTGWRIPQGEKFKLLTRVHGQKPLELTLSLKSDQTDYWVNEQVPVSADGEAVYTFENVGDPVTFYLHGGDDKTDSYRLEVVEKPRISAIAAYYEYPPYAGLENQKVTSGQLRGLEGTKVRIEFESTKPLRSAAFELKGGTEEPLTLKSPTTFSKELILRADGAYAIKLTDETGFREYRPEVYSIEVIPDQLPVVTILAPGKDLIATSQARMNFAFRVTDDFGITSVEFLHARGSDEKASVLSDHITGPIQQSGKEIVPAPFVWDFEKMQLKGNTTIDYFVKVKDCNPTGRGVVESAHFKVNVLRPTDFHLQILFEARKILTEAQLAYKNQKTAYFKCADWQKKPSGNAEDDKWREILELQDSSLRSAAALGKWLVELNEQIERNKMQDDFMKQRLSMIEELWKSASVEVSRTRIGFQKSNPKTAVEAEAERLKATRLQCIQEYQKGQEKAVVALAQLLRKMYDWENLQTAVVNTKTLAERQAEICDRSRHLAKPTLGKEIEALSDEDVERVLTLGQQQASTLEAETSLEIELATNALKAEKDGRKVTRHHLLLALGLLKDRKINQKLSMASKKISNNQITDVINDQVEAGAALEIVKGLLLKAGQDIQEEPVDVAAVLAPDKPDVRGDIEEVRTEKTDPDPAEAVAIDLNDPRLKPAQLVGDDALSQALLTLAGQQRSIQSRTRHLDSKLQAIKLPRYKELKLGMLRWRLDGTRKQAVELIQPLVDASEYRDQLRPGFENICAAMNDVSDLFSNEFLAEDTQKVQDDVALSCVELGQFMARQKQAREIATEHASSGGKDAFDRLYVVREDDLRHAVELTKTLDWCMTLQFSINRQSEWLKQTKDGKRMESMRKKAAKRAADMQTLVVEHFGKVQSLRGKFGKDVKVRTDALGFDEFTALNLGDISQRLANDQMDEGSRKRQDEAGSRMGDALERMRQLLEERVPVEEPKAETPVAAAQDAPEPPTDPKTFKTETEIANDLTPAGLRTSLANNKAISSETRERILTALPAEMPGQQGLLLGAYYQSLIEIEAGASNGGGKAP